MHDTMPLREVADRGCFGRFLYRSALHTRRTPSSRRWRIFSAVLVIATLAVATPIQAQETGVVRGTVTLVENGDLVDGAVILIVGTGAFALTDDGTFEIRDVPVGFYEVTAQREQLTAGRQTVAVTGGGTATADFELSLSPVHEEVTVTPSAVGAAATLQVFNTVTTIDSVEIAREAPSREGDRGRC